MIVVDRDGRCTACKGKILEHPHLICPWCNARDWEEEARKIKLDPAKDPVGVILGCRAKIRLVRAEERRLKALRSRAARALLARDDREELFSQLGKLRRDLFMRWAVEDHKVETCEAGHPRSRWGYRKGPRGWYCRKCDEAHPDHPGETDGQRRRRVHREHAAHAKVIAELLGQRADPETPNLLEPLPLGRLAHPPVGGE